MRWGLRYQLLLPPAVLLLGVAGISTWTALASATRAREQLDVRMRNITRVLVEGPQFQLSRPVLDQMSLLSGAEFVLISDNGQHLSTLPSTPTDLPLPQAHSHDLQSLRLEARIVVDGTSYLASGIDLRPRREGTLYVLYPEALWRNALWEAVQPSLVLGGFLGLASVALAVAFGQRLTRRIQELERRTRQIADGDFSPMPLPRRNDELRDLGRSVNEMAGKLAHLQETVQRTERLRLLGQVSGGLAHHLRNGVAGARLAVQLHLHEWQLWEQGKVPLPDPEALDVALRQLTLVESNLKRFLDLGSDGRGPAQSCSIPALVGEAVSLLQPQCRHAGTTLQWESPREDARILGDPGQLQQLFLNVLGNAIEAAGPGGWVKVGCWAGTPACAVTPPTHGPSEDSRAVFRGPPDGGETSDRVVVEVTDSGSGPPAELSPRLFEPFVTGKPEGVGLGLAVSRQVAEAHGGRIDWSRQQGHTCFRIELGNLTMPRSEAVTLEKADRV
jgi:signal transduction histidine kinase